MHIFFYDSHNGLILQFLYYKKLYNELNLSQSYYSCNYRRRTIEKSFYYKLNKYKLSNEWIFLYIHTITSGWYMFYLHLLIGLIISKKYCRVALNLVSVLEGEIQVKFSKKVKK